MKNNKLKTLTEDQILKRLVKLESIGGYDANIIATIRGEISNEFITADDLVSRVTENLLRNEYIHSKLDSLRIDPETAVFIGFVIGLLITIKNYFPGSMVITEKEISSRLNLHEENDTYEKEFIEIIREELSINYTTVDELAVRVAKRLRADGYKPLYTIESKSLVLAGCFIGGVVAGYVAGKLISR